jgi:hypothetical protein
MYHVSEGCRVTPEDVCFRRGSTELRVERKPAKLIHIQRRTASMSSTYRILRNPTSVYVLSVPLQHRGLRMQPGTPFTSCAWMGSAYCMYHIDEYLSWRRWWH